MKLKRSIPVALGALLLAGSTATPASAGPPLDFEEAFAFTAPDLDNRLVVFINTSREAFCSADQVAREQAIIDWLEADMVDPFPEWALERPEGFQTWTPLVVDTPQGAVAHLNESDQHIELWHIDDPANAPGVGACTDTDDRDQLFAAGTATIKATVNDLFGQGLRPAALDHTRGSAKLLGVDGTDYRYTFSWRLILPCAEPPGRPCEVARFALTER